jgi:hypothetical protein
MLSESAKMKKKYAVGLVVVVALALGWYVWALRHAPPRGQPPLTSLTPTKLEQFKREFNSAADRKRLVLLLSPT